MLAIERKNEILDKLRAEQRVLVSDLAEYYNVTEETIRRDLDKLEKEGYATKTYGGAILGNSTKTDLSYTIRNKTNVEAKTQIAALASRLIEDGDHLMLDDSSTSLYLAKKLKEKKNLTVITGGRCTGVSTHEVRYVKDGTEQAVSCDSVVLSAGMKPLMALADSFMGLTDDFAEAGDCVRARTVEWANKEGYYAAMRL